MQDKPFDNFDTFASDYRQIHTENLGLVGGDSLLYSKVKADWVYERLNHLESGAFLDFGCGDGIMPHLLSEMMPNWKFFGLDVSEESIKIAKSRNIPNSEWTTFDGFSLPYSDKKFDVIFVANVFHHIAHEHHIDILKEFQRVLKSGGKAFYFEHNPFNPVTRHIVNTCPFDKDARLITPNKSKSNFLAAGFSKVKVDYILFFPRHRIFQPFWSIENLLKNVPLGGQYVLTAEI